VTVVYRLGVDLGTTFTAAAIHRDGEVRIFPLSTDRATIPSVVAVKGDGGVVIGTAAERRAMGEPERIAREFKRRIGDATPIFIDGKPYTAQWFLGKLLERVLQMVTEREAEAPARVAVTHPANWRSFKTDLLLEAVGLAGLDPATTALLTEPEAAAMSYAASAEVAEGDIIAVYDLGGGTFDAAILRRDRTGFEILGAPEGVERLGGIDFDAALFNHVVATLGPVYDNLDPSDPATILAVARLRRDCTEAKEALSFDTDATIPVVLPNHQQDVRVVRQELETLIRPGLTTSIDALRRALHSAGVGPADVSRVLLVGGSSRVPLVAQLVSSELNRPVTVDADPKQGVAVGAAYAAAGTHYRTRGASIRANAGFDLPTSAIPAGEAPSPAASGSFWETTGPPQAAMTPPAPAEAGATPASPATTSEPWHITTPPTPVGQQPPVPYAASPAEPALQPDLSARFWSTTTPPTPVGEQPAAFGLPPSTGGQPGDQVSDPAPSAVENGGRRMLFIAIATAVTLVVVVGGLLLRGVFSAEEPTAATGEPATPGPLAGWPASLTVAVAGESGLDSQSTLIAVLEGELGIDVELTPLDSQSAVIEALSSQDAALGLIDPLAYAGATSAGAAIRPAGIEAASSSDTGSIQIVGITRAGNAGINSLADAGGTFVCFTDRSSLAGYQFPAAALAAAGVDLQTLQSEVAGDDEAAIEFVANGTCPIGFAVEQSVTDAVASGNVAGVVDATGEESDASSASADLKVVWRSAPITADPLALGTWLPQDLQDEVIEIVTEKANRDWAAGNGYCDTASACTVNGSSGWGYVPATDADFEGYRQVCRLPDIEGCNP
jgi:ABC-type phosphate/phosphonate transport system substrate-binding protein/actin-like ATPase involved in cell morphogenesis